MKLVKDFAEFSFPITIEQAARGHFRITYGLQVRENLSYTEAAREFGECMFHALACDGFLDNSK